VKRQSAIFVASLTLSGCATAGQPKPDAAPETTTDAARSPVQQLEDENLAQARRIAELEARLSLLEQEARQYRQATPPKPTETVRIGGGRRIEEEEPVKAAPTVVRLYESDTEALRDAPLSLPEPPPGVQPRLGVVPLPEDRGGGRAAPARKRAALSNAREAYRAALRDVRDRHWDAAFDALTSFLAAYSDDPLAANATYWRGEVQYAQRRYGAALQDFETVLVRFAGSEKAADAMLKVGLCHQRLGDGASAERYFRQLREQYPSSDAARIASRENPS
jgi:tol-pal system protein YbgF